MYRPLVRSLATVVPKIHKKRWARGFMLMTHLPHTFDEKTVGLVHLLRCRILFPATPTASNPSPKSMRVPGSGTYTKQSWD